MPSCIDVNASHFSQDRDLSGHSNIVAQPSSTTINEEEEFLEINDFEELESIMQSMNDVISNNGNEDAPRATDGAFETTYFDAPQMLAELQQQPPPFHDGGLSELNIEDYFDATMQNQDFVTSNELWTTLQQDTDMLSYAHANEVVRVPPVSGKIN
jgi:hypothetical protein